MLLPGQWHRYRPEKKSGWTEDWIELRGATVDAWVKSGAVNAEVVAVRRDLEFGPVFEKLHELCSVPGLEARAAAAGLAMSLLARMAMHSERQAQQSVELMHTASRMLSEGSKVQEVASALGLSYITFYRQFKEAMGTTPQAFANQVRLARAENFLASTSFGIKHIADRLGYFSAAHFSQEFKKARGKSPSQWRAEHSLQL